MFHHGGDLPLTSPLKQYRGPCSTFEKGQVFHVSYHDKDMLRGDSVHFHGMSLDMS